MIGFENYFVNVNFNNTNPNPTKTLNSYPPKQPVTAITPNPSFATATLEK